MAEFPTSQPRKYLNQFKNRNVANTTIDISGDVLAVVANVTKAVTQITSSFNQVSQSLGNISGSLASQSVQIGNLEATARSIGTNKLFANKEIPTGNIDGKNTTYTLAHEPILGSDHLYLNGVLIEDGANDYSISGSHIVFSNPLTNGMKLHCTYYYTDSSPITVLKDKEIPVGSIDGKNNTFTLIYTPVEGSEHIYLNGVLQENGGDYSISGSTIAFFEAPYLSSKVRCTYHYFL